MSTTQKLIFPLTLCLLLFSNCKKEETPSGGSDEIKGFSLLSDISGHWVGSNETAFGFFDWFAFDYRPISASHVHSIYEGATNQNIITSFFVADFEGKQQVMARNGGWLGNQYRATYFVLDEADVTADSKYYRLVDAVGREDRAYLELRFENDTLYFDAYKDNSGQLADPIHHMGFKGTNYNPSFDAAATQQFNFPQEVSEVDLNDRFVNLIDDDSALFLEESQDPFPKSMHGYLSDLAIEINRAVSIQNEGLLLYLSTEPIVDSNGNVDFNNLDRKVVRTINVDPTEDVFITTYLHPDNYYITLFSDMDGNFYPSSGDVASVSKSFEVIAESDLTTDVEVGLLIP